MSSLNCSRGVVCAAALGGLLLAPPVSESAEVRLRESLLEQQRDRATIQIVAVVDHIGDSAHALNKDCDLHVPLRSRDVMVPLIGELKNACSEKPDGTHRTHWSHQVYEETHGRAVQVAGVFRIWLEHPPSGTKYHSESKRVDWYKNSGPKHVVELHPITQIGGLDFTNTVKAIEEGAESYEGYKASKLKSILRKKLTIRRLSSSVGTLVQMVGKGASRNHWNLSAVVASAPTVLADGGHRITLNILKDGEPMPEAMGLPAVTVAGTGADAAVAALSIDDQIDLQALIRIDLNPILNNLSNTETTIPLPVEFILLDVN
ncbi:MAG: hypothetical protein GY906_11390 [bacterium]|nr:hypothetical protein [bacterium]